jgi:cobalt-zinc-cadmium efflux system protein
MGTGHDHGGPPRRRNARPLAITLALTAGYMVAEVVGGLLSNSLALLADAGHMFSDAAALALSLFAIWITARPATRTRTYGYYRSEILAALVNGSALLLIAVFIFVEAVERMVAPPQVAAPLMLFIATGGLLMNVAGLAILHGGRNESINLRGAWLHVMSDALGSIGAIVSALLIWAYGWYWADPVASVVIGVFVVHSAWNLVSESVAVLMEGAPGHIDVDELRDTLAGLPAVIEIHDLHVWTITSGMESLSAHVVAAPEHSHKALLGEIRDVVHERFGIDHITVQIEPAGFAEPRVCT